MLSLDLMLCNITGVVLWNVLIEFVWAKQRSPNLVNKECSSHWFTQAGWLNPVFHNVPLFLSLPVFLLLYALSRGCLFKLVNNRMWCSLPAADSIIRNLVTKTSLIPFLPPSLLSVSCPHLHFTDQGLSSISMINYLFFGNSLAGDELTSALIPVNSQALKQARRSFGLVLHCLASSSGLV